MTNDRIQRALDGELPTDRLTPEELETYLQYRSAFSAALQPLESLAAIDVAPEVVRRIAGPGRLRRALDAAAGWLWSPRPVSLTVRPAYAGGGVLALAALAWIALPARTPASLPAPAAVATATNAPPARVLVQFRLGDAQARDVRLIGDFNAWHPDHQLHEIAPGVWSVEVALEPGVYNYGFMIDGKTWRLDPLAPQVTDGFGGASSRVAVLAPEIRS
jgi:hypothetical protein